MLRRSVIASFSLLALLTLASCGDDAAAPTTTTTTGTSVAPTSSTTDPGPVVPPELTLTELGRFESLTAVAAHPRTGMLYVAERIGRVQLVDPATGETTGAPVLSIVEDVTTELERGLLGLAISPDGTFLYLSYSDPDGATRIDEFVLVDGMPDLSTRRMVFGLEQPFPNHNGGDIHFGPDGLLYLGLGDGGAANDPLGAGQDPTTLLGSIIRIDPAGCGPEDDCEATGPVGYAVPADNPFADGVDGAPEVWLYGVRNPWRFSWDRETGDLWIGDVGQDAVEEITYLPGPDAGRGANLGWNAMEGTNPFDGGTPPAGHVGPVHEYRHGDAVCSVTGGYVYRGSELPGLRGAYVYGDFCVGELWAIVVRDGELDEELDLGVTAGANNLASFGEGLDGELFVLGLDGTLWRLDAA